MSVPKKNPIAELTELIKADYAARQKPKVTFVPARTQGTTAVKPSTNSKPKTSRVTVTKPKESRVRITRSKPKRKGVQIRVANVPEPTRRMERFGEDRGGPKIGTTATSAHDTNEATPCRVCGGPVEKLHADRFGPWRQHRACQAVAGRSSTRAVAAATALGMAEVDAETAALGAYRVPLYSDGHREPTWFDQDRQRDRGAWLHVDKKALLGSLSEAMTERDESLIPRPCTEGRCAWCGVEEALSWATYGHRWPDGTKAPLCGSCGVVYERRGRPAPGYPDDARAALGEAVSGVPPILGQAGPAGLLAFIETDLSGGDGGPWSHLPAEAIEAYRWSRWSSFNGKHAPAEHRAEAIARARAAEAKRAEQEAANEAEGSDFYGFTGGETQ